MKKNSIQQKPIPKGYISVPVKTSKAYRKKRHRRKGSEISESHPASNDPHVRKTKHRTIFGFSVPKLTMVRKSRTYRISEHYRKGTTVKTSLATRNRKHSRAIPKR